VIQQLPIRDRETWLRWRSCDLTASDIPAVAGIHPHKSAARVYAEKTGLLKESGISDFLEFRLALEGAAYDYLRMRKPHWKLKRPYVYLRDPAVRMGATPDVIAIDPQRPGLGIIQIKSVVSWVFEREWRELEDENGQPRWEAPQYNQIQTLTEAMLANASWAMVAGLVLDPGGSGRLVLAEIKRHAGAEQKIRRIVAEFWRNIAAKRMPDPNYAQDADIVSAMHPKELYPEPPLDLTGDNMLPSLLAERQELKRQERTAKKRLEEIDAEIKHKVGDHACATLPGWAISLKTQRREEFLMPAWEGRVLRVRVTKVTQQGDQSNASD
jgi:hypothetical protein